MSRVFIKSSNLMKLTNPHFKSEMSTVYVLRKVVFFFLSLKKKSKIKIISWVKVAWQNFISFPKLKVDSKLKVAVRFKVLQSHHHAIFYLTSCSIFLSRKIPFDSAICRNGSISILLFSESRASKIGGK